jgi:hypothetical protein
MKTVSPRLNAEFMPGLRIAADNGSEGPGWAPRAVVMALAVNRNRKNAISGLENRAVLPSIHIANLGI